MNAAWIHDRRLQAATLTGAAVIVVGAYFLWDAWLLRGGKADYSTADLIKPAEVPLSAASPFANSSPTGLFSPVPLAGDSDSGSQPNPSFVPRYDSPPSLDMSYSWSAVKLPKPGDLSNIYTLPPAGGLAAPGALFVPPPSAPLALPKIGGPFHLFVTTESTDLLSAAPGVPALGQPGVPAAGTATSILPGRR